MILFALTVLLVGCCPQIVPTQTKSYKSDTVKFFKYDSVFFNQIDTIREYLRGDTFFVEKIKYRYRDKLSVVSDTVIKNDSILVEKTITETKMTTFQSVFFNIGLWLSLGLIFIGILKLITKFRL